MSRPGFFPEEPRAAAPAPAGLRPLGRPRPLQVARDAGGLPARVRFPQQTRAVAVRDIDQVWRIAEEWWRDRPLRRTYYQLRLVDGRRLTCFCDDASALGPAVAGTAAGARFAQESWFAQEY